MQTHFKIDSYVTGKSFVGRRDDVKRILNLISSGESIALYGEPGTGKTSLLQHSLIQARLQGINFQMATVDFTRARTMEDILVGFGSGILKAFFSSESELRSAVSSFLGGTHFVFDSEIYSSTGNVLSSNWLLDDIDVDKVFALPQALMAERVNDRLVIVVEEFQSISFAEENYMLLKHLESVVEKKDRNVIYIFTGSHMNAMRDIFDIRRFFWRSVERFAMSDVDVSLLAEYINHGFQLQGKVLEKDLIVTSAQKLRCNVRYVVQLFFIIDSISRGYVSDTDVRQGMSILLAIHAPRFYSVICSLTAFQLSLLRAIMAGEVKFSSSVVIDRYNLNSSANVKRLKDALVKKEVVWFDDKDEPHIQDPLFEYWLATAYFI